MEKVYNTIGGQYTKWWTLKPLRGNYAGIGMTYDEDNDIFISKKYYSWVLNVAEADEILPTGDEPDLTTEQDKMKL